MEIRFEATGPDQEREKELADLFQWLADDRALRGHVRVERVAAPAPGRMGPGLDAVLAVLSTAVGAAQLPLSYLAWRQSRRPPVTINIIAADSAEAAELLRRMRADADGDGGPGGAGGAGEDGGSGENRSPGEGAQ